MSKPFTYEYQLWVSLRHACHDPKSSRYHRYGALGIKVDERWRKYFKIFLDDIGLRPSEYHTLRRYPDTDGDFKPGNIRWELRFKPKVKKGEVGNRTHGMSYSPEYRAWHQMKQRCLNSNHPQWDTYGGLGIKIFEEWIDSFAKFFEHIGTRPSPKHSLDRWPDPYGSYVPGNVRWATMSE